MPIGPYSQDVLTRIVNVKWGGGVFIAGDLASNVYYLKPGGDEPAWQNLGKLDFGKEDEDGLVTGRVAGSAYAAIDVKDSSGNITGTKPVFILVGGSGFTGEIGIIMASSDGLSWSKVFTFKGNPDSDKYKSAGIFGVVWNETAEMFYAGGHQSDNFADNAANIFWMSETDILFQSADGYSWSEAGRHEMRVDIVDGVIPPYPKYKTGLLVAQCRDLVKDANNNNIPDGNYGYDKSNLLIAPTVTSKIDYLFGTYLNDIPHGSAVTVTGLGEDPPPPYPSNTGIPTTCVATVGGEWVAAGGTFDSLDTGSCRAVILKSSEEGSPQWERLDPPGANVIITLTGGVAG
jgi:hypothetical protein